MSVSQNPPGLAGRRCQKWDQELTDLILDTFLDAGGTLIDTAHVYSDWVSKLNGMSERTLGKWLKERQCRNQVVLMTKGGHPDMRSGRPDLHKSRMTGKDMEKDLHESLEFLGTDWIDIYFYHRDDVTQPVCDLIEVMEGFRKEG